MYAFKLKKYLVIHVKQPFHFLTTFVLVFGFFFSLFLNMLSAGLYTNLYFLWYLFIFGFCLLQCGVRVLLIAVVAVKRVKENFPHSLRGIAKKFSLLLALFPHYLKIFLANVSKNSFLKHLLNQKHVYIDRMK